VVVVVAFVVFSAWARSGWFVAFDDQDQAVIYQGRPGGVLWIEPTADAVGPARAQCAVRVAEQNRASRGVHADAAGVYPAGRADVARA
jgi:hypothetical protein